MTDLLALATALLTEQGYTQDNADPATTLDPLASIPADQEAATQAKVVGHFDGLCEAAFPGGPANPGGTACGGWHILPRPAVPNLENGLSGHAVYCSGPGATSNVAEYHAALDALRAIYRSGWRGPVVLRGDSKLVIEQFNGRWQCSAPHLQALLERLHYAASFFESVDLEWVPRAENAVADQQSRRAYRAATKAQP